MTVAYPMRQGAHPAERRSKRRPRDQHRLLPRVKTSTPLTLQTSPPSRTYLRGRNRGRLALRDVRSTDRFTGDLMPSVTLFVDWVPALTQGGRPRSARHIQ
jgi:hypothetical protein